MSEDDAEGTSPGGSRIYRHVPRERGDVAWSAGDPDRIADIEAHIERHIGPVTSVFHEIISDRVHLDVAIVAATDERPVQTLVTMGMSELPMQVPAEVATVVPDRAELVIVLPPDWDLSDSARYWPLGTLKTVARLPHDYDTWLGPGHTVPHGDPPEPYVAGSTLVGVLVLAPQLAPREFWELERGDGERIGFHSLVFLTREELDYKLQHGSPALFELLEQGQVCELLEVDRRSVIGRSGRRWPWGRRR